jgi:hypothetical protein
MKIISISFRRTDILEIQRAAWKKYVPHVDFFVAAHHDHLLEIKPDITLNYDENPELTLWPNNYKHGVQQVLDLINDDVIVCEGDIFPVKEFDLNAMFKPGSIREWMAPYPGLLFMPKKRLPYTELNLIGWERLTPEHGILPFEFKKSFELIGDVFLHWNHGDVSYRVNPEADPRTSYIEKFCDMFDIEYKAYPVPMAQARKVGVSLGTLSFEETVKRKKRCTECPSLSNNSCLEIRKLHGCSACSSPWKIYHNTCPKGNWKEL